MATQLTCEPFNLVSDFGQDHWQQVIHCTEAKLKQSEAYQQFLVHLHKLVGKFTDEVTIHLNSILRNTIQLTLQESQSPPSTSLQDDRTQAISPSNHCDRSDLEHHADPQLTNPLPVDAKLPDIKLPGTKLPDIVAAKLALATLSKTKENLNHNPLRLLGQEIKRHRTDQAITLEKLNYLTLVPIYHLRALEAGNIDQLPEPVYVRGFIQRICRALGMDSDRWLANLPSPETSQTFLPSWQPIRPNNANLHPSSLQLYLGYAALMTGAVGGLIWTTQPSLHELPSGSLPRVQEDLTNTRSSSSPLVFAAHMSIATPETLQ